MSHAVAHLARCTVKGCKHVKRVDVDRSGVSIDRFGTERRTYSTPDYRQAEAAAACPEHGCGNGNIRLRAIRGTVTDHECDARCITAKGPICECSCGGANHGSAH